VSRECAISKGSFGLGRDCSFDLASKRNHAIPPFGNNETKAFCSFFSLFKHVVCVGARGVFSSINETFSRFPAQTWSKNSSVPPDGLVD
jgi:hypothetical protein